MIKLFLISVVFLFIAVTGVSLLIPSHITISKAINIRGEKESIFSAVRDRNQWYKWHPAFKSNSAVQAFDSIRIISQTENDSEILMSLQQNDKDPVINGWKIFSHTNTDSLTLQWYMKFDLKWYPWKKLGSLFYENTYGVMMQEGLENLKGLTNY
ncbi:MAG: hypothetical protein ACJ75F_04675 [Flavisolibacter sp.]